MALNVLMTLIIVIPSVVVASTERNGEHEEDRKAGELNDTRYRNNDRVVWESDVKREKQTIDSKESQKRHNRHFPFESLHAVVCGRSIQRNPPTNIGGHVEVFAFVDGGFALVEAAFGDDFEGQLGLAQAHDFLAAGCGGLPQLRDLFGR